jgi:hypothetical protein
VELKIDVDRDLNGPEVALQLRGTDQGGIPWIVITDATGKEIVNSDGPGGNIGCPVTEEERGWFMTMLEKSTRRLAPADLDVLRKSLAKYAETLK